MNTKCKDHKGNQICTNGRDTYHNFNMNKFGGCNFCTPTEPVEYKCIYQIGTFGCSCNNCYNKIQESIKKYLPTEPVEKCKECQFEKGHSQGCSEYIAGKPFESTEPVIEDWEKDFDKMFYEGDRNSVHCKKHKVYATPFEIKAFIRQTRLDLLNEIEYLKKIHEMELDAISLKSLEYFIIWSDNRKNKGLQVGVDIINKHKK